MPDWVGIAKSSIEFMQDQTAANARSRLRQLEKIEREAKREGKELNERFYEEKAKAKEVYEKYRR